MLTTKDNDCYILVRPCLSYNDFDIYSLTHTLPKTIFYCIIKPYYSVLLGSEPYVKPVLIIDKMTMTIAVHRSTAAIHQLQKNNQVEDLIRTLACPNKLHFGRLTFLTYTKSSSRESISLSWLVYNNGYYIRGVFIDYSSVLAVVSFVGFASNSWLIACLYLYCRKFFDSY
jgi:hypothetical protein